MSLLTRRVVRGQTGGNVHTRIGQVAYVATYHHVMCSSGQSCTYKFVELTLLFSKENNKITAHGLLIPMGTIAEC